ncbi:MAG: hypothetical protein CL891_00925 [Dehalococcoidia bacterium]|nr:hypothetical protein [Dehalococcoidia bacterium]
MTKDRLRIGIVGANGENDRWGAKAHVPAALSIDEVELVAVATSHEESAKIAQQRSGARLAFSNYHELVKSSEVDLVTISVRVAMHYPIVMEAIAAKKHIFCEWPLALDSSQASKMLHSAKVSGIGHAIGTQSRFSPGLMYLKQLVENGAIGEPLMFNMTHHLGTMPSMPSHRWWLLRKDEGGGVTLVTTGHAIDIARWILGDVKAVCGKAATFVKEVQFKDKLAELPEDEFNKVSAFDSICFAVEMESGVLGVASTSIVCKGWGGFRLEIQGTEGRLIAETPDMIQFSNARLWMASGRGGYRPTELKELTVPTEFTNVHTLSDTSMGFHIAQELRAFVNSIRNGERDFSPGFKEGLDLHRIIEAIIRSSDTGSWENV